MCAKSLSVVGMQLQSLGIVGGGAWGTALATVARRAGRDVLLWASEPETVAAINEAHCNDVFLPGVRLDDSIKATTDLSEVARCDAILIVSPAQHLRDLAEALKPSMRAGQRHGLGRMSEMRFESKRFFFIADAVAGSHAAGPESRRAGSPPRRAGRNRPAYTGSFRRRSGPLPWLVR